ncbi:hypothetical protein HMPREF9447_02093 [Bacteroides oleiciplenus YIT 12058]|uniref:Uncharacterized protein n=1 Tax=Bacteroides oleiciplenus YIT 12058 TaxID=742727 RepID=K9ENC8_9BACE|nr:hypothetical protein HMPREF9447_02093 [Bacteroides oleiciplenus YIT 12058]
MKGLLAILSVFTVYYLNISLIKAFIFSSTTCFFLFLLVLFSLFPPFFVVLLPD